MQSSLVNPVCPPPCIFPSDPLAAGVGIGVWGEISGFGFRAQGLGTRDSGGRYQVSGVEFQVSLRSSTSGYGWRVSGVASNFKFRVSGCACQVSGVDPDLVFGPPHRCSLFFLTLGPRVEPYKVYEP